MKSKIVEDADVITYVVVCDPGLNIHVVLGLSDGTTRGGHLIEGQVFPTLELVVTENPAQLRKVMHPDLGVALIDLDQSDA
jgi:predicted DNA-binding protein with PD1-like motif